MELTKLNEGIYGTKPVTSQESITLAVHPFMLTNIFGHMKELLDATMPRVSKLINQYNVHRDAYISSNKQPIITFEEFSKIDKTFNQYKNQGLNQDMYFIETIEGGPQLPNSRDWSEAVKLIDSFNANVANVIGGYYDEDDGKGCLNGVLDNLTKNGLKTKLNLQSNSIYRSDII